MQLLLGSSPLWFPTKLHFGQVAPSRVFIVTSTWWPHNSKSISLSSWGQRRQKATLINHFFYTSPPSPSNPQKQPYEGDLCHRALTTGLNGQNLLSALALHAELLEESLAPTLCLYPLIFWHFDLAKPQIENTAASIVWLLLRHLHCTAD